MTPARRKSVIVLLLSAAAPIAVGGFTVRWELSRFHRQADHHAETGEAVLRVLGRYRRALSERSLELARACFKDPHALDSSVFGGFRPSFPTSDGVERLAWSPHPSGARAIEQQLADLLATTSRVEAASFKLRSVEEALPGRPVVAAATLWLRGLDPAGRSVESRARYRLWLEELDGELTISKQRLVDGETVRGTRAGFVDVTAQAGIAFASRHNPDWADPAAASFPRSFEVIRYIPGGATAADYDGDGWYDLFLADGVSSRLYRNRQDGGFRDVTFEAGLPPDLGGVHLGLFADFDNDGDQDLFVGGMTRPNRLFQNNGDGSFRDATLSANVDFPLVVAASVADYDNDGQLDLYLGRYLDPVHERPTTPFLSRRGPGNVLLRNLGRLRFDNATRQAGAIEGGHTLALTSADFDRDGWQDIYVANDFGRNALLRNEGDGTFTDVAAGAGALAFGYSMSASAGDLDNDGELDLYIAGIHSGQRWYGQSAAVDSYLARSVRSGELRDSLPYLDAFLRTGPAFPRLADHLVRGNTLLIGDRGTFTDVSEQSRINPHGWYWGTAIFDFDNDGWKDVYAANGWISAPGVDDL